jgi:hypothetical protein
MPKYNWISELPEQDLNGGIQLLNKYGWNLSVEQRDGQWAVFGGDQLLLSASSKPEADSFLYGMALVLATLPTHVAQSLEWWVQDSTK